LSLLHHPAVQRWLGGHVLCKVAGAGPRFALTFDDGPSPRNTPGLLDVLARHGARATFFVLAGRARRHAALVRRIAAEGHEVGVHGRAHLPPWTLPRGVFERDLEDSVASVREACGAVARYYRAPFGLMFPLQAALTRAHGLTPVLGSIYPRDHSVRRADVIARRVLDRLEPGAIVILHDSSALWDPDRGATVRAVDKILKEAAARGLRSVSVTELVDGGTTLSP
jgi:peptidoglycan/xylan/chitin deacetylase (PgdA/CDA1 family)